MRQYLMFSSNQFQGVSPRCGRLLGQGVTAAEKAKIVDLHNQLRLKVAKGQEPGGGRNRFPPAADMMELIWDPEVYFNL